MSSYNPIPLDQPANTAGVRQRAATVRPHVTVTIAALLAAANAYVVAATIPMGASLAWIVPGIFLAALRVWRPVHALLYGTAFGTLIGLGMNVAQGSSVDVLLGSLLSVGRGPALLSCALPYGLVAFVYAAFANRMPSSARGSFAAWLWPGAEILRNYMAPETSWIDLGTTQHLGDLFAGSTIGTPIVSFVMVLMSCTMAELLLDLPNVRFERRSVLRWGALPALAVFALYVNVASRVPAGALTRSGGASIANARVIDTPRHDGRRIADRPLVTPGAVLTAI
jgi:hypothetical protein